MTSDLTEAKPPPVASNEDAEALLDTANSASQHVAVLHVAFMALCAYVLVIVFGTTDMDLLIGKGVKLPVVGVTVSIVGFYFVAPYLVVLVHFNLLLQLQLLSRKLYAFDAAAPNEERIGGPRDRLHIFPFTYYLVGRPGPIVWWLLGIVVGITLLVLPLATLLVLQLRFLAYQDQTVTWAQRVAVWLDVALVIILWPVIMDPRDSWRDYLRRLVSRLHRRWRMGLAWAAVWVGVVAPGFATTRVGYFSAAAAIPGLLILLGLVRGLAGLVRRWRGRRREPAGDIVADARLVRGMPGLLLVVALGAPLPLGLLADGEWWEEEVLGWQDVPLVGPRTEVPVERYRYPVVASEAYYRFRSLDLSEQVLLAKPAKPGLIAQLREGDPEKVAEALKQVEPVKLRGRSLRGAWFNGALLPGADLRFAQLRRADLTGAQLQGADLSEAKLQGASLYRAQLQGADLVGAGLEAASLLDAELQGAVLGITQLQGAELSGAKLQGATLREAQLQGADLYRAKLQGAELRYAQLEGADLSGAQLQGADLRYANLYSAIVDDSAVFGHEHGTVLLDLRAASWTPLNAEQLANVRELLGKVGYVGKALERIEHAGNAGVPVPLLGSCLIDPEVTPGLKSRSQGPTGDKAGQNGQELAGRPCGPR